MNTSSAQCQSCGAPLVWLKTKTGKTMPVNQTQVAARYFMEDRPFESGVEDLVSHFATCNAPSLFRKKEKKP